MVDLLRGAMEAQTQGINILLYGPPGTGKTEFCKALSAHVGMPLFVVDETDNADGDESRGERIRNLRYIQKILGRRGHALVLFDEMEDLLTSLDSRPPKAFYNRLIEQARVPTLWTCNDIESFDPALLRRMTLAIEVTAPPVKTREKVWARNLRRWDLTVSDDDANALARDFEIPPALAANAVRATKLANGNALHLRMAVKSIAKAMNGGQSERPAIRAGESFDLGLINADCDLASLHQRLGQADVPRTFSLCLSGPPGTGKSAYVRHLAQSMGMEIVQKRASDLLGMFVGESERNIAEAFAEATARQAFLIFDEADSLLSDRTTARQSWEVSQVNEMLTWMECHPLPFACTTNLMDRLDSASLRRFTIKTKFGYLTAAQAEAAFVRYFGQEPPAALRRLSALTPGDFAVVKRKAAILGNLDQSSALLTMLEQECAAKPGVSRPIGFL